MIIVQLVKPVAHFETKKEMDLFGPGSLSREAGGTNRYQEMLDKGKARDGQALTEDDKTEVRKILARRRQVEEELKKTRFQSATLTFDPIL